MTRTWMVAGFCLAMVAGLLGGPRKVAGQTPLRLPVWSHSAPDWRMVSETPLDEAASSLAESDLPAGAIIDLMDETPQAPAGGYGPPSGGAGGYDDGQAIGWQVLPRGLIYRSYLAGPKESRMSGQLINEKDDGWLWDATLGSRVGILRYGTYDPIRPQGFQLDVEGSAQLRLDIMDDVDVRGTDFRAGVPLTFGFGNHQTKLAYYHLSSHLGDEFLLKHPGYNRLNFARDALVLGHSIYLTDSFRVYGEASWAFYSIINKEWEFLFGFDYAPRYYTGPRGAPFFAVNGHLREELNFGGILTAQAGWAWRAYDSANLFRMGLHFQNGKSNQYSFYNEFEQQVGFAIWYDW